MKNYFKALLIFSLFASLSHLYPQDSGLRFKSDTIHDEYYRVVVRTVPSLTLELNGNYDFGIFELSANDNGDFSSLEFKSGENFGVRHGFGLYAAAKFNLQESGHFRLCVSGSYSKFSSKFSKLLSIQNEEAFAEYAVYTVGIGVENSFTPSYKFKPVVGLSFIASVISGSARLEYPENVYTDLDIKPAFRLGLSVCSGIEYLLNNKYGLNCGIRVVHANIWLKDTKVSDNPNEIYLNDKRVVPRIPYSGWRQFAWGELYAGVNYYFGITQKEYVIKKMLK